MVLPVSAIAKSANPGPDPASITYAVTMPVLGLHPNVTVDPFTKGTTFVGTDGAVVQGVGPMTMRMASDVGGPIPKLFAASTRT
jgi:hypothetical protein